MEDGDTFVAAALFGKVLSNAVDEIRGRGTPVYTFAFYHDHESAAISVCVDTEANSVLTANKWNAYWMKHFAKAINAGDLKAASMWRVKNERNLSLGDFALVNVARTRLVGISPDKEFYLAMIRSVWERQMQVAELSPVPERLLFCCSGAQDEVAYTWLLNRPEP
jgi:hypothetical protein